MGLRLSDIGTSRLWWSDLRALIVWSSEGSAIGRLRLGERAGWDVHALLMTSAVNVLQNMSWQLGGDAKKPKPKPILPPGMEKPGEKTHRGDVMSIEEMDRRLAKYI